MARVLVLGLRLGLMDSPGQQQQSWSSGLVSGRLRMGCEMLLIICDVIEPALGWASQEVCCFPSRQGDLDDVGLVQGAVLS